MKKTFLFSALSAIVITLSGCSAHNECYNDYEDKFIVKNETDKTIVVKGDLIGFGYYGYGYYGGYGDGYEDAVTIAPGKSEVICSNEFPDLCDNLALRRDGMNDNCVIPFGIPESVYDEGYAFYEKFKMNVDEEPVSEAIWQRRYWSFEGDYTDISYTLTVTDELLAKLTPVQPEQPVNPSPATEQ